MIKKTVITICCDILIGLFLLTSCASSERPPTINVDSKYINQQILLRAPKYANTYKTKDVITLELKYNSNNEIIFPNNYNLRIFEETINGWTEIKERPTERIPSGDVVFSPEKYMPAVEIVFLHPELPNPNEESFLRIYVIGKMKEGDEIIDVAAYTTIVLSP